MHKTSAADFDIDSSRCVIEVESY